MTSRTVEKVNSFFNPKVEDLYDPFLMKDMDKAIERIQLAQDNKEGVLIFGDYDVDGTTSRPPTYRSLGEPLPHQQTNKPHAHL